MTQLVDNVNTSVFTVIVQSSLYKWRCLQEVCGWLSCGSQKWPLMGRTFHRSYHRTGTNEELKTSSSLTRGRGMTEKQCVQWLLSMPACTEVNRAMQELTDVKYSTGEQNKEITKARQTCDMKNTNTVLCALEGRNPFSPDTDLRNIMTGVTADSVVNVEVCKEHRETLLASMIGHSFPHKSTQHFPTMQPNNPHHVAQHPTI